MTKDVGSLHDLSTQNSAVTKVKAKQHVNFKSGSEILNCEALNMEWYTWLHIVCGHMIRMLEAECILKIKHNITIYTSANGYVGTMLKYIYPCVDGMTIVYGHNRMTLVQS